MEKIALVILAAGSSSRLGQPKQLVVFEGKTLLRRVVETALGVPPHDWETPVAVVLGAHGEACRRELDGLSVTIFDNENHPEGMGSSVGLAAQWAAAQHADALLLLLCDQPFVTIGLLENLLNVLVETGRSIVACDYENGVVGVPVLFAKTHFTDLLALRGDRGAQAVLRQHPDAVATVTFPEGRFDVDTPEQLAALRTFSVR